MDIDECGAVSQKMFAAVLKKDAELCQLISRGTFNKHGKPVLSQRELVQLWDRMEKDFDDELALEEILSYLGDAAGATLLKMEKKHNSLVTSTQITQEELNKAFMESNARIEELGNMLTMVHETEERMMSAIEVHRDSHFLQLLYENSVRLLWHTLLR